MNNMAPSCREKTAVLFDAHLVRKYDQMGPRYTSYPTADRFDSTFHYSDYLQAITQLKKRSTLSPLSLYLHIPFCQTVCYYCACNKIATKQYSKITTYLTYLKQEIRLQGQLFEGINYVSQLHLGGGTPTYLSDADMTDLMQHVRRWFQCAKEEDGEYSIEVDPRTVSEARIAHLREVGFNRLSLGVQDFDPTVQEAVNRIQPEKMVDDVIRAARKAQFRSINIDLIYGLPRQTLHTIETTLEKVLAIEPDRISLYNYAHLPHLFKAQRRIASAELPDPEIKLAMLQLAIERLCASGYVYIGMDHFAKPEDDLAIAQQQGRLHRNFQGYATHAELDMIACGVSAISSIASTYSQHTKTLEAYYDALDNNQLPIVRGITLSMDDLLRRFIIQRLMCNFELSLSSMEMAYPITFHEYFRQELAQLRILEADGLVQLDTAWLSVTPKGRLLIRNICMIFDRYLPLAETTSNRYSKTI